MHRLSARISRTVLGALLAVAAAGAGAQSMTVYKSATCGCCSKWIAHMERAGIGVEARDVADLSQIKDARGVPAQLRSCHTALIGGYVIEGHVPAADVLRLLEQRPAVAGLAVPGMPIGSPGMEVGPPQPYSVIAFDRAGRMARFATHGH